MSRLVFRTLAAGSSDIVLSRELDRSLEVLRAQLWTNGAKSVSSQAKGAAAAQIVEALDAWTAAGHHVGRVTYTAALRGLASVGNGDRADLVYHRMRAAGHGPTRRVLLSVARAHAVQGNVQGVLSAARWHAAELGSCKETPAMYQMAMRALAVSGDEREALRVFQLMQDEGVDVTVQVCEEAVAVCTTPAAAAATLERVRELGHVPSLPMYNNVLTAYLKEVVRHTPSTVTNDGNDAVLEMRKGVLAEALRYREKIPYRAVTASTESIVMKLHAAVGDVPRVLKRYQKLRSLGAAKTEKGTTAAADSKAYAALLLAVATHAAFATTSVNAAYLGVAEAAYKQAGLLLPDASRLQLGLKLAEVYSNAGLLRKVRQVTDRHRDTRRKGSASRARVHPVFTSYMQRASENARRLGVSE